MKKTAPALLVAALLAGTAGAQTIQVDPSIQPYKPVSGVSGNLSSIGSDTLNNLMTLWAEKFNRMYPNVKIQIEGKGSSTARTGSAASSPGRGAGGSSAGTSASSR